MVTKTNKVGNQYLLTNHTSGGMVSSRGSGGSPRQWFRKPTKSATISRVYDACLLVAGSSCKSSVDAVCTYLRIFRCTRRGRLCSGPPACCPPAAPRACTPSAPRPKRAPAPAPCQRRQSTTKNYQEAVGTDNIFISRRSTTFVVDTGFDV